MQFSDLNLDNLPKRDSSTYDGLDTTDFLDALDIWETPEVVDLG